MEIDYIPGHTQATILCCQCGVSIPPNTANMCVDCIKNEVDITEGIPKQATVHWCKFCERYLQPPGQWVPCQLESKELLSLCLKRLKGLSKVRLVDAGFIWTEPHSKRIKVKLTIQKEVFAAAILQQTFVVEYVVANQMCDDCRRVEAKDTWKAVVQLRQKVNHKKTFFFLEQIILKHKAHKHTTSMQEKPDGLDFFFASKTHASKFVDFINTVAPVRSKTSEELISADLNSNTFNYKFTFSVEIAPICKEDLICLPVKMRGQLGQLSPLILCSRVSTTIHLIDVSNLNVAEVPNLAYWKQPFVNLCSARDLIEYVVLDLELLGPTRGKYALANVQVARASDLGQNDITFLGRTHLGHILQVGDSALGYDITRSNFNNADFEKLDSRNLPDFILVKKSYAEKRKKNKTRAWQLKRLEEGTQTFGYDKKKDVSSAEQDFEEFIHDLEEDPELRTNVNMYKDPNYVPPSENDMVEGGDEDVPEVPLEELLDEMRLDDPTAYPDEEPDEGEDDGFQ